MFTTHLSDEIVQFSLHGYNYTVTASMYVMMQRLI